MATTEEVKKTTAATTPTTATAIQDQYAARQAEAEKLYNQRQADANTLYDQRTAAANQTYNQRIAEANQTYNDRQAAANNTFNQRNAQAQQTYDQRLAASQGKISDLYAKGLAAQQQQLKTGLDKSIAAQEEARAKIAPQYQTAANDLAVQYERNRRNLNMQAMAQGLNTGTGSQQQLALNQGFAKGYAGLRAQEAAEGASIDRQIANIKVDYQNAVSQAMADNDYKKAAALMDDYNNQLAWLDSQKQQNQNYYDQLAASNQSYLDTQVANSRNYIDQMTMNNQNRLDTVRDQNMSRFDKSSDANRDWADSEKRYMDEQTLQKAQTLASFGDFSGYAAMYGQDTANVMREMWIAQNPDLAWRTGAISADQYRQMTGAYPAGYTPASSGGGGGYYYGGPAASPKDDADAIYPTGTPQIGDPDATDALKQALKTPGGKMVIDTGVKVASNAVNGVVNNILSGLSGSSSQSSGSKGTANVNFRQAPAASTKTSAANSVSKRLGG